MKSQKKSKNAPTNSSLRTRLIVMSMLFLLIPSILVGLSSFVVARTQLNNKGKDILVSNVNATLQLISLKNEDVKAGKLSLEEAQEQVKEYMLGKKQADGTRPISDNMKFGENGYLVVYGTDGLGISHPTLENQDLWDVVDKKGNKFVQDIIKVGQQGGGYVYYDWNLPNSEIIREKISYSKLDDNWGWIISSSAYMEEFNKGAYLILMRLLLTLAISSILGIGLILLFAQR